MNSSKIGMALLAAVCVAMPVFGAAAKAGDKLIVPKVEGECGFYRVWVDVKPF